MFQYFRLQFCCLIIMILLGSVYEAGTKRRGRAKRVRNSFYVVMIVLGIFEILFDGISAVTVNYLDVVPHWLNVTIHAVFFESLLGETFLYFLYMLRELDAYPRKNQIAKWIYVFLPYIAAAIGILCFIDQLEFRIGKHTNYSMGVSVYICFSMLALLFVHTGLFFCRKQKFISKNKRYNIAFFLVLAVCFSVCQILIPEALLTSACVLFLVLGVYLTQENPLYTEIAESTNEMVMGFATLVENRDDSTGGHIKRTSSYVEILAKEMRRRGVYSERLTADYIEALKQAAPMHDVGKIAIPDSILQKPGRLTDEEFKIMKNHSSLGSDIILKTFGQTGNKDFTNIAFEVAKYHHEKWNGKGYPEGLVGNAIPLSARIMAIADVFDAVTEKRCYKEQLSVEESFKIIEKGSGSDFDPKIVEVFLDLQTEINAIHDQIC